MAHIKTEDLTKEENKQLMKCYIPIKRGQESYVRTIPGNYVLPKTYEKLKDQIYNLKVRLDDIFVVTWPKNGTTWTQEMVWCILNDADIEMAKKVSLRRRFPFLDLPMVSDFEELESEWPGTTPDNVFKMIEEMKSPRMIKSHLLFELLPNNLLERSRVILCLRNPKDTLVSYYHHQKLFRYYSFDGNFADFFNLFMNDLMIRCSYWKFTLQAWKERHRPNVCLLFYEDMKKDLGSSIRKVANFLKKELDDSQVESLNQHLSFKKMKENTAVNFRDIASADFAGNTRSFMRKGEIGDWKNYFTEEMNERMNKAIEEHFKDTGLSFVYE